MIESEETNIRRRIRATIRFGPGVTNVPCLEALMHIASAKCSCAFYEDAAIDDEVVDVYVARGRGAGVIEMTMNTVLGARYCGQASSTELPN